MPRTRGGYKPPPASWASPPGLWFVPSAAATCLGSGPGSAERAALGAMRRRSTFAVLRGAVIFPHFPSKHANEAAIVGRGLRFLWSRFLRAAVIGKPRTRARLHTRAHTHIRTHVHVRLQALLTLPERPRPDSSPPTPTSCPRPPQVCVLPRPVSGQRESGSPRMALALAPYWPLSSPAPMHRPLSAEHTAPSTQHQAQHQAHSTEQNWWRQGVGRASQWAKQGQSHRTWPDTWVA